MRKTLRSGDIVTDNKVRYGDPDKIGVIVPIGVQWSYNNTGPAAGVRWVGFSNAVFSTLNSLPLHCPGSKLW